MKDEYFQDGLTISWERVLSNKEEIIDLFKMLNVEYRKDIQILSRTILPDDRLVMMIEASDESGRPYKIIVDATFDIPAWSQYINVTFEQGTDSDVKIILYGHGYDYYRSGGTLQIGNLVRRNNRCNVTTLFAERIDIDPTGHKIVDIREAEKMPTKRQVQEAEFWEGNYRPQQGCEGIDADYDMFSDRCPYFFGGHDFEAFRRWGDDGFIIGLVGELGSDVIQWTWDNKRTCFENEYPGCPVRLIEKDGKPYAIIVRIWDISMTDLINIDPKKKWEYAGMVLDEEHKFGDILMSFMDKDYKIGTAIK